MIKIAICDDENVIASQIENIIWNICKEENGNLMVPGTNAGLFHEGFLKT